MQIQHGEPSGGNYVIWLPAVPLVEFERVSDGAMKALDASDPQFSGFSGTLMAGRPRREPAAAMRIRPPAQAPLNPAA